MTTETQDVSGTSTISVAPVAIVAVDLQADPATLAATLATEVAAVEGVSPADDTALKKKPRAKKVTAPAIERSPTRTTTAKITERYPDFVFLGEPRIALDTETTGIGHNWHRVLELAMVEFDSATGQPSGRTYYTLLNPEQEVDENAAAVHGKTWDMLKEEPVFEDIYQSMTDFLAGSYVVIHNKPFDEGFLDAELKRVAPKAQARLSLIAQVVECSLSLSRDHVFAKKHTLDALCARYAVDRSARTLHGALIDCELLAAVYPALMADVEVVRERIRNAVPFNVANLPSELDDLVEQELQLASVIKMLESIRRNRTNAIKQLTEGLDRTGEFYLVEYTDRTTTDWDSVVAEHLGGIDLAPYRKQGSAMKVRYL